MFAGAGIEGDGFFRRRAFSQQRDVRDAAQIERDAIFVVTREEQRIHARDERRALAARGAIGAAKIVADRRLDGFADDKRIAELEASRARRRRATPFARGKRRSRCDRIRRRRARHRA